MVQEDKDIIWKKTWKKIVSITKHKTKKNVSIAKFDIRSEYTIHWTTHILYTSNKSISDQNLNPSLDKFTIIYCRMIIENVLYKGIHLVNIVQIFRWMWWFDPMNKKNITTTSNYEYINT